MRRISELLASIARHVIAALSIAVALCSMALTVLFVGASELSSMPSLPHLQQLGVSASEHAAASRIQLTIEIARNAWLQGNANAFAQLFVPAGECIVPGQRAVGAEAIRQMAASYFEQYVVAEIEISRIAIAGDLALVEWRWRDVNKNTGLRSEADDAIAIDFRGSRIQRWREYIDAQTPQKMLAAPEF